MTMERHAALALATLLVLAACGSDHQDQAATRAPSPGTGPVKISSGNAFSPLVQDLNKAKALNGKVQQQGQATDQAIESQSGAPAAATQDQPR
jgi:ABC-type glycerol-3-phosphate transport system substrate-binding protein